jgi:hypothetical protein
MNQGAGKTKIKAVEGTKILRSFFSFPRAYIAKEAQVHLAETTSKVSTCISGEMSLA